MPASFDPRSTWSQAAPGKRVRPDALWRYAAALGIIGIATLVSEILYRAFDTTRLSMVFLAGILVTAVTLGASPAYFSAATAFFVYNFYLVEPRFTFQLVSAEDVIVLVVFLAVAMLTGGLAGRMRDEALRNKARAHTTGALFAASRELSEAGEEDVIRGQIVRHIAEAAQGQALLMDRDRTWHTPETPPNIQTLIQDLATTLTPQSKMASWALLAEGWQVRRLHADGTDLGVAAWRRPPDRDAASDDDRLIHVLIDIGAAAMMRARLGALRSESQALARTQQLRDALLSSISHDLRTPLAAILASSSSLRDFGEQFTPVVRADLVATIQEEAIRLNRFVGNLLSMTKLESGALDVDRQVFDVIEVLNRVAKRFDRPDRPVQCMQIAAPLLVGGDPILLEQALGNVAENATRYAPVGAPISIRVSSLGGAALIEIEDSGPGVPADDLERIFDKFYRSPGTGQVQGTGLGLSIARGLIEAMDGTIVASRRPDGAPGLLVAILLAETSVHAA